MYRVKNSTKNINEERMWALLFQKFLVRLKNSARFSFLPFGAFIQKLIKNGNGLSYLCTFWLST